MTLTQKTCNHLAAIDFERRKEAAAYECEECIKKGDRWVHLRTCQECGITLCCDSSPNQHASKHAREKHHNVIISAEPGERWAWCYEDAVFLKY